MIEKIYSDNVVTDGRRFAGCVYLEKGKITAVEEDDGGRELPFDSSVDVGGSFLTPGFIDTHTHGALGADFTFCTAEEAVRAVNYHASHGTTTILPTTLASDYENTARALRVLREAKARKDMKADIAGVHIEGPYFAPSQAGAQNPLYLTDPEEEDYVRILDEFGSFVKKWSYAPERDKDARFCRFLTNAGVLASAGHTAAVYEDMAAAYGAGLRCVTHLYSCTSTITRVNGFRRLGVVESAYLFKDMDVELIADGRHVPPELIRLVFQIKGAEHIMLVSDSLSITGADAKEGVLNGVPYIVEDGVAKLTDRSAFAGSIAAADRLVAECVKAGVALEDAVRSVTETPARALGLKKGRLAEGYAADLVVFDENIRIKKVFVGGREL